MVSNVYINGDGAKPEVAERGWIVQKFGGTSVGKFAVHLAEDIVRCVGSLLEPFATTPNSDSKIVLSTSLSQNRIAVVCSARSSCTKAEGTTNRYVGSLFSWAMGYALIYRSLTR